MFLIKQLVLLSTVTVLCVSNLARADNSTKPAVSNVYMPDSQSTVAINLAPDSNDVNFFIQSPTSYSYFAIGIGSGMANSLMLVVYSAADNQHITVSPRLGVGDFEPAIYSSAEISVHDGTSIQNSNFVASFTCTGCRSWPGGALQSNTTMQPFIFALGPSVNLASDDKSAGLRRHTYYGHFTMDTIQATGPGGAALLTSVNPNITTGAALAGAMHDDLDKSSLKHGLVMAIMTLAIAPIDLLAANALRRYPVFHIITSTGYLAFMIAGLVYGIKISGEYIATRKFDSPHQVLGLLAVSVMVVLLSLGIWQFVSRRTARKTGQNPQETRSKPLVLVYVWSGRFLWVILLAAAGTGLSLAAAQQMFIIGFAVFAAAEVVIMTMIQLCIFYCLRKTKKSAREEEEEHSAFQLAQMYAK